MKRVELLSLQRYVGLQTDMQRVVSVVIPAFNRGFIIREALESVLNQTYHDWEALVVNDGSTDDTSEVVKEYTRKDSRIRLIEHDRQRGAQAARNTALRAATGNWIAFLDSDDRWLPDSLEIRLKATEQGSQVVHSECCVFNGEGNLELFAVPPLRGHVYRELLRKPGPMFQGLLISRGAFARLGYLDENIVAYQEWDTAIRLAKHFSFEFVVEPTFIYDCRHANTISKDSLREAVGYEQIVNKHRWSMLCHLGPRGLAHHYQRAAFFYLEANQEDRANRCLIRAVMCWPFRLGVISGGRKHFLKLMSKRWTHAHRDFS
jgi:glycosyltransferase involved in cell wall biosynthesis